MYGAVFASARNSAQSRAATIAGHQAESAANNAIHEVENLKQDVEKLLMITEALWGIIQEQLEYDDEELIRRIEEIDLRDGKLDGRVKGGPPPECPQCGRVLIGKRPQCLYCGTEVKRDPFER